MKRLAWIIPVLFFIVYVTLSFVTLKDYGWNWDSFQHFTRGQAYYHFFTSGKTTNDDIIPYQGRISIYEKTPYDYAYASKIIFGHPPTTDIILATFNQLLFKKFGLIGDLEAYHLYGIFLTSIAAVVILLWSYKISGFIGVFVSLLAYISYPLLFAEQHFNIKDTPVAAYNIIFLYLFWLGITKKSLLFLLFSAIIGGLSMGTKFNIVFLSPIIAMWLFWVAKGDILKWIRKRGLIFSLFVITIPCIMFAIFYSTYPALWSHPLQNILKVVRYYQDIGGNRCPYVPATGLWFLYCTDWQTVKLFIVTIPFPTLLLALFGGICALKSLKNNVVTPFLWFMYIAFVVLRVVLPINNLYGGALRQIMEINGPLALLSGYAGYWIYRRYRQSFIPILIIFLCYIPVFIHMIQLHPNENLYTNVLSDVFWKNSKQQFINGIVSYGNAYKQGINWINTHAQSGSTVAPVLSIALSIPSYIFRSDILYNPKYWSAYEKRGEYLIELVDAGSHATQFFPYKYATNILQPVYEAMVEGFPIVRVWKNDQLHTRQKLRQSELAIVKERIVAHDEIILRLQQPTKLQSLQIIPGDTSCRNRMMNSYVLVSEDGKVYQRMYETIEEMNNSDKLVLVYPFAGEFAEFIKVFSYASTGCDWSSIQFEVKGFQ